MNDQPSMMNQPQLPPQQMLNQNMIPMNPQMVPMNRSYGMWGGLPPPPPQFQNPNPGPMKPPLSGIYKPLGPRSNWKGKKSNDKMRSKTLMPGSSSSGNVGVNMINARGVNTSFNNYQPPGLNDLQHQNRVRARKFFPKKFNNNNNNNNNNNRYNNSRSAPYAPRNTTSFIIRAKKSGGIASLVSPSPMTPAVLPTPIFSPSKEVLVDMAKEEWGVDGYGSMKGLIRLRSPGHGMEAQEDEEDEEGGSSDSDVEEHVEVERRLDHDLSRFEMIYNPNGNVGGMLENRVDDQDTHIAHLEEENLILKERLFLMERELGDLRRRMQFIERKGGNRGEINEEVVENESENDSSSRGEEEEAQSMEDNNEDTSEENDYSKGKSNESNNAEGCEEAASTEKTVLLDAVKEVETLVEDANKNDNSTCVEGNNDETKCGDGEVKAEDICMGEVGVGNDHTVLQKDVANM